MTRGRAIWGVVCATLLVVISTSAHAQGEQILPTGIPQLASRLAADTSLSDDELVFPMGGDAPPAWRQAFTQAAAESRPDAVALRTALAQSYALHLSADDLRGAITFFESPAGASFEPKYLRAAGRPPNNLTPDEIAALRTFAETAAGKDYAAAERTISQEMLPAVKAVGERLLARAQRIHCRNTGDCSSPR